MIRNWKLFVFTLACLLAVAAWADSLQLKNGSIIKGKYLGGTETEVAFQVGSTVQRYAVADVERVTFDAASRTSAPATTPSATQVAPAPKPVVPATPPPTAGAPQLAPRPAQAAVMAPAAPPTSPKSVTVPTGTRISIRTIDAVDSDRNQVGDRFKASLEQPLVVNEVVVVPKGADVYGRLTEAKQAGQIQGRSQLKLELIGIVVNGQTIPIVTGDYQVTGASRGTQTAKRAGGGAAVGALIGAIAGGGKGAAIGAGVGAGAGTAVQVMTQGEQVHVPSETLLEFTLQQDIRMPVATSAGASK